MFGISTYVISLKGREDRRKTFDDNWKSYDYEYVDFIDGDDLDIKKLIQDGVINDYFLSPYYFIAHLFLWSTNTEKMLGKIS